MNVGRVKIVCLATRLRLSDAPPHGLLLFGVKEGFVENFIPVEQAQDLPDNPIAALDGGF